MIKGIRTWPSPKEGSEFVYQPIQRLFKPWTTEYKKDAVGVGGRFSYCG